MGALVVNSEVISMMGAPPAPSLTTSNTSITVGSETASMPCCRAAELSGPVVVVDRHQRHLVAEAHPAHNPAVDGRAGSVLRASGRQGGELRVDAGCCDPASDAGISSRTSLHSTCTMRKLSRVVVRGVAFGAQGAMLLT